MATEWFSLFYNNRENKEPGPACFPLTLLISLIQCKLMIEYDRYVWLKSDQVNFGQNRKYLYLTCHVVIPSHLYNHRRNRALLSFTLMILYVVCIGMVCKHTTIAL